MKMDKVNGGKTRKKGRPETDRPLLIKMSVAYQANSG